MATAQTFNMVAAVTYASFSEKFRKSRRCRNLIEVQKASYDHSCRSAEPQGGRPDEGLQTVFKFLVP